MRSSYPRTSSHSNYQNGDCVTGGMAPGPSLAMKMWRQVISKLTPLVCMSVRTRYSGSTRSKNNERCHRVKRQICGNIKKAFFLKLSYSKVRAFFTHLGRGGHL